MLFPLIKEFDESENMNCAKEILDNHSISVKDNNSTHVINFEAYWDKDDDGILLRHHHDSREGVIT